MRNGHKALPADRQAQHADEVRGFIGQEATHRRIHALKQQQLAEFGRSRNIDLSPERDAIRLVARDIALEATLLAFDEFQVTDIADALIMTQLFGELWRQGTVVVATSNRPPEDLYKSGLNRSYFLPFLDALAARCIVHSVASETDYRLRARRVLEAYQVHPDPFADEARAQFRGTFEALVEGGGESPGADDTLVDRHIPVMMGRELVVPLSGAGVAVFEFEELCDRNLGAADFKAVCDHFHTVMLQGVPQLTIEEHNQARRFVTLVDELYEHKVRLICSAEVPAAELFSVRFDAARLSAPDFEGFGTDRRGGPAAGPNAYSRSYEPTKVGMVADVAAKFGLDEEVALKRARKEELDVLEGELASVQELGFAFRRAASRLSEMGGAEYLRGHAERHPGAHPLPTAGHAP